MKKVLIAGLIGLATFGAQAQHHHHHGHWRPHHGGGWGWVVPAVVGGVVVYEMTKPPAVIVQPQTPSVIYTERGVYETKSQQNCSPWTEIKNPDGSITVTRTCQ